MSEKRRPTGARSDNVPADVERLLRLLPQWFGIEQSVQDYVRDAHTFPTYIVRDNERDTVTGVLLVKQHFPSAAEVHLMAVDPTRHRQGIGRALLQAAEEDLRSDGVKFLQVKTLSHSRADDNYELTRRFYYAQGFSPLEEFTALWDADNPCLLLVKTL